MGGRPAMPAWPAGQILFFEGSRPAPPARILMAPEAPQINTFFGNKNILRLGQISRDV